MGFFKWLFGDGKKKQEKQEQPPAQPAQPAQPARPKDPTQLPIEKWTGLRNWVKPGQQWRLRGPGDPDWWPEWMPRLDEKWEEYIRQAEEEEQERQAAAYRRWLADWDWWWYQQEEQKRKHSSWPF